MMSKNQKILNHAQKIALFSIISASMALYSGCSGGRHVTSSDGSAPDDSSSAPSVTPAAEVIAQPIVNTGTATTQVPVNGLNGCSHVPRSTSFATSIAADSEAGHLYIASENRNLPYLTSVHGSPKRLDILGLGASNYGIINGRQTRTLGNTHIPRDARVTESIVINGQVVFEIVVQLPPRDLVRNIDTQMNIHMRRNVPFLHDTEMFCYLPRGHQVCSGLTFDQRRDPQWYALLNPLFGSFAGENSVLRNSSFNDRITAHTQTVGTTRTGSPTLSFSLSEIFAHGSTPLNQTELLDLLYSGVAPADQNATDRLVESHLFYSVSDDTLVNAAELQLNIDFDCRELENRRIGVISTHTNTASSTSAETGTLTETETNSATDSETTTESVLNTGTNTSSPTENVVPTITVTATNTGTQTLTPVAPAPAPSPTPQPSAAGF